MPTSNIQHPTSMSAESPYIRISDRIQLNDYGTIQNPLSLSTRSTPMRHPSASDLYMTVHPHDSCIPQQSQLSWQPQGLTILIGLVVEEGFIVFEKEILSASTLNISQDF
jgi:hypothetical protein